MQERTTIGLTRSERELLAEVLEHYYRDLKQQIGRTEDYEFREGLKARRDAIESVLRQLGIELS